MVTPEVGFILVGVFLIQEHIAQQSAPHIASFQQIMAKDTVFLENIAEGQVEDIYVIDAFPNEGPFFEKILVYIRGDPGIGVDARNAALHVYIKRSRRNGDTR